MLMDGDGNMYRHGVSGLTATWWEIFSMLRQTFWQVRPGGLFTSKQVSSITTLAFGMRLLKYDRLLLATSYRGHLNVKPLRR
jgi:hypothetical protein